MLLHFRAITRATRRPALRLLLSLSSTLIPISTAAAQSVPIPKDFSISSEAIQLSKFVVAETKEAALANAVLNHVAGGTNLVDAQELSLRRVGNIADALAFQPGVFATSVFGGESVRLSIRGSGIQRAPTAWAQGVQTFFDDLSVTDANGTPYESFEPLAVDRVEVFRGANAFLYSPISLGGAINYVTKTGRTAAAYEARVEVGSFGYYRLQLSSGAVHDRFDYYTSITGFKLDGYRRYSEAESARVVANLGYRFRPDVETRLILRFATQRQQTTAGTLTWAELQKDPRQPSSNTPYLSTRQNLGTYSIGSVTTWKPDADSRFALRFQFKDQPIENTGGNIPLNLGGESQYKNKAAVGSFHYDRDDTLFGRLSQTTTAFYFTKTFGSSGNTQRANGSPQSEVTYGGSDLSFVVNNDLKLTPWLTTSAGLAVIDQKRVSVITFPTPAFNGAAKPDYFGYAPRFGLRADLTKGLQFFANASRSVEAPININYARATAAPITNYALRQQKANTYEVGTRGRTSHFDWNVGYYYTTLRDELLSSSVQLEPPPALPVIVTANSSPTVHRGIEAGLGTTLWRSQTHPRGGPSQQGERLLFRGTYTFSDFYFRSDPLYGHNRIPAVPRQQLQTELRYESASGFYAAASARAVIGRYAVDFANTLWTPAQTIYGARLGYAAPAGRWTVFLDADNLTNKKYASSVTVLGNARGVDSRNYYPGLALNFTSGLTLRF